MPAQKRKHLHDVNRERPIAEATVRRSTRQRPDADSEPEHQLRSGRSRTNPTEKPPTAEAARPVSRGRKPVATATNAAAASTASTRTTRKKATSISKSKAATPKVISPGSKENARPFSPPGNGRRRVARSNKSSGHAPSLSRSHSRSHSRSRSRSSSRSSTSSPSRPVSRPSSPSQTRLSDSKVSQSNVRPKPSFKASVSTSTIGIGITPTTPKRTLSNKNPKPPGTPHSDRNINNIVFGSTYFKAWYPSYYGKEVLGDVSANVGAANAKIGGKRDPPMLDVLYICPCCFKYSKEAAPWRHHVQLCSKKALIPGKKVYTHPHHLKALNRLHTSSIPTSPTDAAKGKLKGKNGEGGQSMTINEGGWSVWEVDGEKEGLFCQNLSLFAKLFLDNKSVFFDVTGFNYFLLVYTPPSSKMNSMWPIQPTAAELSSEPRTHDSHSADGNVSVSTHHQLPPRPQIVGFFSKEKMSWDNNNLACILVFPPWQRKGLGALLMGVSYEISRREGILGGPEKPISELGRKGYKRFWAGEIIRWILELDLPISLSGSTTLRNTRKEKDKDRGKEKPKEQEILVVDVEQCSRDTWIAPEDCLAVLREMGIVEEAGLGLPKDEYDTSREGSTEAATQGKEKEEKESRSPLVPRVRIDKAAIRAWALQNKIELTKACDPDGFIEGYAIKQASSLDEEE